MPSEVMREILNRDWSYIFKMNGSYIGSHCRGEHFSLDGEIHFTNTGGYVTFCDQDLNVFNHNSCTCMFTNISIQDLKSLPHCSTCVEKLKERAPKELLTQLGL